MNVHAKVNAEQKKLTDVRAALAQLSLVKKPAVVPPKAVHVRTDHPDSSGDEREGAAALDSDHDRDVDAHRVGPDPARVLARAAELTSP